MSACRLTIYPQQNMESDHNEYGENQPSYSGGPYLHNSIYQECGPSDADHATILNGVRNRRKVIDTPCCPVCSCTVRPQELHAHLVKEMDNLNKLSTPSNKRKSAGTPNSSSSCGSNGFSEDIDVTGATGSEVYERVKRNREKRLRAVSRRAQASGNPNTSASSEGSGNYVVCPVCGRRVLAATAERHVDTCLRNEDRNVDVENDVEEGADEDAAEAENGRGFGAWYSWGSEERVRAGALQLREGGALPPGALLVRRASTDTTLVVDGDDDEVMYGPAQYSPQRITPQEEDMAAYNSQELPVYEERAPSPGTVEGDINNKEGKASTGSSETVVDALKARIRELEHRLEYRNNDVKCLICMGAYTEPVISIQCWHVHCETCWLESLRAKKTCPQCNAITTATHLRRIYI